MIKKEKIILFASSENEVDVPKPSKRYLPSWYIKSEQFIGGKPKIIEGRKTSKAVKSCFPFLDSLTSGYIVELHTDIEVTQTVDGPSFKWPTQLSPLTQRDSESAKLVPVPLGCGSAHLIWTPKFIFKTPPGYSTLITHPLNRHDLPFVTLSGVVDSDKGIQLGNYPFFLAKNFEGIIEAGTPIMQLLPFKRENWDSKEDASLVESTKKISFLSHRKIAGGYYRDNVRAQKSYK
jgi:hypothetical protein